MTAAITDLVCAVDARTVMDLVPHRPRVLALGEPTHVQDGLLEVRNDLFRDLVEHHGYRTIAIESDCLMGLIVDDHVTTGAGTLDDVMRRGFSHGWGTSAGNRELVRWMRAYNEDRPASERVRFAGFDGPLEITGAASPRQALTALYGYLTGRADDDLLPCTAATLDDLLGDDARWTDPQVMMDASRSFGRTPEAQRLRLLADDLTALLDAQTPQLLAASSREEWHRARLYARTAAGLLRYHAGLADPSPGRLNHLLGVRDAMMAGNLLAATGHGPVLAHANNSHLQRDKSSMMMWTGPVHWWSAGAIVDAHLGEDYAFLATALGTMPQQGVGVPPADTLEGLLYALPQDRCLVDGRGLLAALGEGTLAPRVSPYFGYAPLDPAHLSAVDGVVFVKDLPQ